jgi:hypothetical protein
MQGDSALLAANHNEKKGNENRGFGLEFRRVTFAPVSDPLMSMRDPFVVSRHPEEDRFREMSDGADTMPRAGGHPMRQS